MEEVKEEVEERESSLSKYSVEGKVSLAHLLVWSGKNSNDMGLNRSKNCQVIKIMEEGDKMPQSFNSV